MKRILAIFLMMTFFSINISAEDTVQPVTKEVQVGISEAFVPKGFDSNSEVYVVVSGLFPNGCYMWKEALVESKGKMIHEIRAYADVTQGICVMVLVPFSKEVQLGRFEKGEHTLRFLSGDGTFLEKTLIIN